MEGKLSNEDYYHVVVDKGASVLNKACNRKCQIFNGSLVNCTPELSKPLSATWKSRVRNNRLASLSTVAQNYNSPYAIS